MSDQLSFYRKYRPTNLKELVGQEHIKNTLAALFKKVKNGQTAVPHAILLTGHRGVGKTTIARILAYQLNDQDYQSRDNLDIIEIDAASHNKVDQIRDLVEKASIAPATLKYKVYIIDEVHALAASQVSFAAFLKTLEEPPAHVIFILATTEIDKVPPTIISRCQRFALRPIEASEIAKSLLAIAKKEGLALNPPAADLIASHSSGSLRDALSILDQLAPLERTIDKSLVREALGLPKVDQLETILTAIKEGQLAKTVESVRQLVFESGSSPKTVASELGRLIRQEIVASKNIRADLDCLQELLEVDQSPQPETVLEVALIKRCRESQEKEKINDQN